MKIPKKEEGQGLVEYALLLVLVAVIIIAILTVLGSQVMIVFAKVTAGLNGQVVTGEGKEAVVTSFDLNVSEGLPCTATITDITFVGLDDGAILADGSVNIYFTMGDQTKHTTGSTGSNGMGTSNGTISFTSGKGCGNVTPGK